MRIGTMIGAFVAASFLAAGLATAETIAEKREDTMEAMGRHMKAMGQVAKGEKPFSDDIAQHAKAVATASQSILDLFPEGSGGGDTRAKDDIWAKWPEFEKAAANFQTAAPTLIGAAESGDQAKLGAALQAVGKTCGGCHKPFRKPET